MKNKIESIQMNESCKEFYEIENDSCPICGRKFIGPTNLAKIGNIGFDLECFFNTTREYINIK